MFLNDILDLFSTMLSLICRNTDHQLLIRLEFMQPVHISIHSVGTVVGWLVGLLVGWVDGWVGGWKVGWICKTTPPTLESKCCKEN